MTYVMTGWQQKWDPKRLESGDVWFNFEMHQPNEKIILGKTYVAASKRELYNVINDLVHHPNCKRFIATKLCRHFITDNPTEDMINPIIQAWEKSDGFLPEIHKAVVKIAFKYASKTRKFQQPETWALQMVRMFGLYWIPNPDKMKYTFYAYDRQSLGSWINNTLNYYNQDPKQEYVNLLRGCLTVKN